MPDYLVVWEIELDAETPREAAEQARMIQRDPTSMAGVFEVSNPVEGKVVLDLDEEERG